MVPWPPGPNSQSRVDVLDTGSLWCVVSAKFSTGRPVGLFVRTGKVNPSLAVMSSEPIVTRVSSLVTSKLKFAPVNEIVAVFAPEPMVTVSVPSPVQVMLPRQLNVPLVETVVDVTTNGSAAASDAANRASARTGNPMETARFMSDPFVQLMDPFSDRAKPGPRSLCWWQTQDARFTVDLFPES